MTTSEGVDHLLANNNTIRDLMPGDTSTLIWGHDISHNAIDSILHCLRNNLHIAEADWSKLLYLEGILHLWYQHNQRFSDIWI